MVKNKKYILIIISIIVVLSVMLLVIYNENTDIKDPNNNNNYKNTVINFSKTKDKKKFKINESRPVIKDIYFKEYFSGIRKKLEQKDIWNLPYPVYSNKNEYIKYPYLKSDFKDKGDLYTLNLYLVAKFNPEGRLLSTNIIYSPDKRLNPIAINMIKKISPIQPLPVDYKGNIEVEFGFSPTGKYVLPELYLSKELLRTFRRGDIAKGSELIRKGADINTVADCYGAMRKAVDSNNLEMVKFLISNGYNFTEEDSLSLYNFEDEYKYAIENGSFEIYKYLTDYAVKNNYYYSQDVIETLIRTEDSKKIKYFEPIKKPEIVLKGEIRKSKTKALKPSDNKKFNLSDKAMIDYLWSIDLKIDKNRDKLPNPSYGGRPPVKNSVVAKINKHGCVVSTKIIESSNDWWLDSGSKVFIKKLSPFKHLPKSYKRPYIEVQFDFYYYEYGEERVSVEYFINEEFLKALRDDKDIQKAQALLNKGANINTYRFSILLSGSNNNKEYFRLLKFIFDNGYIFTPEDCSWSDFIGKYYSLDIFKYLVQKALEEGMDVNKMCDSARCHIRLEKALNGSGYKYNKSYKHNYIQEYIEKSKKLSYKEALINWINDKYIIMYLARLNHPLNNYHFSVFNIEISGIIKEYFRLYPVEMFKAGLEFYKSNSKNLEIDKKVLFEILEKQIIAILEINFQKIDLQGRSYRVMNRIEEYKIFFHRRGEFFGMLWLYYTLQVLDYEKSNYALARKLYLKYGSKIQKRYNTFATSWNKGIIPEYPYEAYKQNENYVCPECYPNHVDMKYAKLRYKSLPLLKVFIDTDS